jgi:hypothetical protein
MYFLQLRERSTLRLSILAIMIGIDLTALIGNQMSSALPLDASSPFADTSLPQGCQAPELTLIRAETASLWLFICGEKEPQFYVSINKATRQVTRLPLHDYDDHQFIAHQLMTQTMGKGVALLVLTNQDFKMIYYGRQLDQQTIIDWQKY